MTAADLIRSGRPQLLIGTAENEWLEAKRDPYRLSEAGPEGARSKLALAQDVASFANGSHAAVIVIGLATQKRAGYDVIHQVHRARASILRPEQHRAVIDEYVFPTVEGLTVTFVPLDDDEGVLVIDIPDQPPEYKPFLVRGSITGDRVTGGFISIVQRRGADTISMTPAQLHAMIATGRAFLRGEPPPRGPMER